MDYIALCCVISLDYFSENEISIFKYVSKTTNYLYENNYQIKKMICVNYLNKKLHVLLETGIIEYTNDIKNALEYSELIKILTSILYNNIDPQETVYERLEYRKDRLNPLKNLRYFKYEEIKKLKQNSIVLQMALDHAEKPDKLNRVRELFI